MLTGVNMFMDAVEQWVKATRSDNFVAAKIHAENMMRSGELLAIHPEFKRLFAEHYPTVEPKDALMHLCQFILCATDGREQVVKNRGEQGVGQSRR